MNFHSIYGKQIAQQRKRLIHIRTNPGTWKYFKAITDNKPWRTLHRPDRKREKCPVESYCTTRITLKQYFQCKNNMENPPEWRRGLPPAVNMQLPTRKLSLTRKAPCILLISDCALVKALPRQRLFYGNRIVLAKKELQRNIHLWWMQMEKLLCGLSYLTLCSSKRLFTYTEKFLHSKESSYGGKRICVIFLIMCQYFP